VAQLGQLPSVDVSSTAAERARALEVICGAVVRLVDASKGHAQRRAIRRFLLEIAWHESTGATARSTGDRRGLWGLSPRMARVGVEFAASHGLLDDLAGLVGTTQQDLRQASQALANQTAWPANNLIENALMTDDRFAALVARCFVLTLPGAIPQVGLERAAYWAARYGDDLSADPIDLALRVGQFTLSATAANLVAPPTLMIFGVAAEDSPSQRDLPYRNGNPLAFVIHTTGDTEWSKIIRFYTSADGLGPHYAIEVNGTVHQIVDEDVVAFHTAIFAADKTHFQQGYQHWSRVRVGKQTVNGQEQTVYTETDQELSNYRTWRDTWHTQGLESPLDLVTGAAPNNVSVGIELEQTEGTEKTPDIFTDAQYEALIRLVADIAARQGIQVDRDHLLGHYDCDPYSRSNSSGGWDPGERFNWTRLIDGVNGLNP
jgi:N-acetyl-anhydromuramyl-L-alanine amidase AmpD